jgi:hypothetical protein
LDLSCYRMIAQLEWMQVFLHAEPRPAWNEIT